MKSMWKNETIKNVRKIDLCIEFNTREVNCIVINQSNLIFNNQILKIEFYE